MALVVRIFRPTVKRAHALRSIRRFVADPAEKDGIKKLTWWDDAAWWGAAGAVAGAHITTALCLFL